MKTLNRREIDALLQMFRQKKVSQCTAIELSAWSTLKTMRDTAELPSDAYQFLHGCAV